MNFDFDKFKKGLDLDYPYSTPVYFRLPYEMKKWPKENIPYYENEMEETKQFTFDKITSALLKTGSKYVECDDYDDFMHSDKLKFYEISVRNTLYITKFDGIR